MIVTVLASESFLEQPLEKQLSSPWVIYNPLYLLTVLLLILCIVPGRIVHKFFDQDGPVRPDELYVEREARIQWVYATDGPFTFSAFTKTIVVIYDLVNGQEWIGDFLQVVIDVCYVAGNIFFLSALRRKDVAHIRMAIVANALFALGLVLILIYGLHKGGFKSMSNSNFASWIMRATSVLFFVAAPFLYSRLWSAHGPLVSHDDNCMTSIVSYLGQAIAALLIWVLISAAVAIEGPKTLWATVS